MAIVAFLALPDAMAIVALLVYNGQSRRPLWRPFLGSCCETGSQRKASRSGSLCTDPINTQTSLEPAKSVHSVAGTTVKFEFSLPSVGRAQERGVERVAEIATAAAAEPFVRALRTTGAPWVGQAWPRKRETRECTLREAQDNGTATPPFLNAAPRLTPPRGARRAARVRPNSSKLLLRVRARDERPGAEVGRPEAASQQRWCGTTEKLTTDNAAQCTTRQPT